MSHFHTDRVLMTRAWQMRTLVLSDSFLLFQALWDSLPNVAAASPLLAFSFASSESVAVTVEPRYMNFSTGLSLLPFSMMWGGMSYLVQLLLRFYADFQRDEVTHAWDSLSIMFWSWSLSWAATNAASAKSSSRSRISVTVIFRYIGTLVSDYWL